MLQLKVSLAHNTTRKGHFWFTGLRKVYFRKAHHAQGALGISSLSTEAEMVRVTHSKN